MSVPISFVIGTGKYAILDNAASGYNVANRNAPIATSGDFAKAVFLEGLNKYYKTYNAQVRQSYANQLLTVDQSTFNLVTGVLANNTNTGS